MLCLIFLSFQNYKLNICICTRDTEYQQIQIYMANRRLPNPLNKLKRADADPDVKYS